MATQFGVNVAECGKFFSFRGSGYLLGSALAGRNSNHKVLSIGIIAIGASSILIGLANNIWLTCIICLVNGFGGGVIDVLSNTLIVWVHRDKVDPWMQAMHFGFGVGALVSPVFVAVFGYKFSFIFFGSAIMFILIALAKVESPSE